MRAPRPDRARPVVVYLDHVARMSGGEIALVRLLEALRSDVDAHVLLGEDGPLVERLQAAGARVEVLAMDVGLRDTARTSVTSRLPLRSLTRTAHYAWRLRRRVRELDPDLVHTNSLKAALYGGVAGRAAGVPVVWHVRDRIADDYLPGTAVRLVRTAARLLPSAVIANSRATLATLPPSRTGTVVQGAVVPDSVTAPATPRSATDDGPLVFGVVGRLAEWKGQHVFLQAFARAFGGTAHLGVLVGGALFGEQAYEARLRAEVEALGLAAQVELTGFRDDVDAQYRRLDVLVHCSTVPEPFGQVVVEGMAAGLAVVAAAAGGPLEIVEPEVDGLLVPPDDVDALAGALRRLEQDRVLLRRLGQAAALSARRFTPEATAAGVLAVYRQVLGR